LGQNSCFFKSKIDIFKKRNALEIVNKICNAMQGPSCQALQETAREGNVLHVPYFMTDRVKESYGIVTLKFGFVERKLSSGDVYLTGSTRST
jgi:hypothetical protein